MTIKLILSCLVAIGIANLADTASAHGDKPHPKCKRGYTLDGDHKCVRKR
jgi:hypothetical protein